MKKAERAPVWADTGKAVETAGKAAGLLTTAWETTKSLFDPRKADEALRQRIPEANLRAAVALFLVATVVGAILSLIIYAETLYFAAFTYQTLAAAIGGPSPEPDFSSLGQFAVFVLIVSLTTFLVSFCQDGVIYYGLRLTGGKGTFTQQYYLSAFVALATAASSAVMVFGSVPCMGALAFLAYLALAFYFMFVVRCRAYATVHDLSYLHVLTIVFLSCIVAVAILLYVDGSAASTLHIPQAALYNLTNMTNVTGV
jgi:hypothetical protein